MKIRPAFIFAILFSVAICYERVVDIEVFKPYRLVGAGLIISVLFSGRMIFDRLSRLTLLFVAIGVAASIPSFLSQGRRDDVFLNTFLIWIFNIGSSAAVSSSVKSKREVVLLAVIHSLAMVSAALVIAEDASQNESDLVRSVGDFKNPANASVSMLFACVTLWSVVECFARPGRRIFEFFLKIFTFGFFAYAQSLTGSRAGFAALVLGVLVFMIAKSDRKTLLCIHGLIIILLLNSIYDLIFSGDVLYVSESNILAARLEKKGWDFDRAYLWKSGLDALWDTGGAGVGLARYPEIHREYFAPYAHLSDPRWLFTDLSLHNDYVSALVECGIAGFVVFVSILRLIWRNCLTIRSSLARSVSIAVFCGMLTNGLSHCGFPYFAYWFYFGLLSAWHRMESK